MASIHLVVRRHQSARLRPLDRELERQQVNLTKSPLRDQRTDRDPLMLLVIAHQVLRCRNDAKLLDTSAVAPRQTSREHRVLRERLEPAAAQRSSLNIDCRAQEHVCAFGLAFCGEEAPELEEQVRVECCA
jgi:hypothetical protein